MNAQQKVNNTQSIQQGNTSAIGGNDMQSPSHNKQDRQMNKYILQFKEQQLENDYKKSQTKQLSQYSFKIFAITIIPLLVTTFLLPFTQRSGGMPFKMYIYYFIPIVVFIVNIFVQKKFSQLFDWTHTVIVLILHLLICWQMVDNEINTFSSFSEFYKGFIFANVYIFLYMSSKYTTKVFMILVINISGIFLFPHHSNIWILVTGQVFLMLMLIVKFYNEDLMKRQLFLQTQKQNLWDSIIEEFLPINLIVLKYNKTTQRLELTQTNKCARKKLRIVNDDHLQHFLDSTLIENTENTTQFFMNNQPNTQNNLEVNMAKSNGNYQSGNLPVQRQPIIPQAAQADLQKSLNGQSQSYYQQNVQKNSNDKFTLKKLLKNKLLKQLELKNQPLSEKQQQESERARKQSYGDGQNGDTTVTNNGRNTNNTFENLESYTATFVSENGRQKQLTIKVFTFCLVDNFAVLTIESESFKSKLKKQERKNEFFQTFYKDVMQRFEKGCNKMVSQVSQLLRVYGSQASQIPLKFKEILQIGYEMLIVNKNATDFIHQQEKQKNNHNSKRNTQIKKNGSFSINKAPLNSSFGNRRMSFQYNNNKGKQIIDVCEFNPGKEIFGWLNIFQSKLQHKKIHFFHEFDEMIGVVKNDKNKFGQIIFNLLDNATKFTPVNGKLAIFLKRDLISQHVINIRMMNSIEKELDMFPLIRDLESTLQESTNYNCVNNNNNNTTVDEDYYNVLKKIKLGIPVSRKLIQLIGPNNHLNYNIKNNQIVLHFQIFSDIRILKDIQDDQSHSKPHSSANQRRQTSTLESKIPKIKEKIQALNQNGSCNQNLTTREFKTNPFISAQSTTSLPDVQLGKQLSFGQKINQRRSFNVQKLSTDKESISNLEGRQSHQHHQKPKHHTQISYQQYKFLQPTSSQLNTILPTTHLPIPSIQTNNNHISQTQPNQVSNQQIYMTNEQNLVSNQSSSNNNIPSFVFTQNKIQQNQSSLNQLQPNQKQNSQQTRNRINSNQSYEGSCLSDRTQQMLQDQKIRSLSNQYQPSTQDPSSNFTLNIIDILPSTNELMYDLNSPEFVQSSENSKVFTDLLQTNQNLNRTQQTSTTSLSTTQNKNNKNLLLKQKINQIQAIFESSNENNLENSHQNIFQQNQRNGIKTTNKLLNSQKQLLIENELDVIKLQKLTLSKVDSPRTKTLAQQNIANETPKRKCFQQQFADRIYLNADKINQSNNANQSISSASGSKHPLSHKNENSKKINISCPQTPETVKGQQLLKELNSPAEQSNITGDCYNSVYNSIESSSLKQLKIVGISCERSVNKYQLNFFPANKNNAEEYEVSSKREHLPYIPKKSGIQEDDQQVSFDGWQNVDEQHDDSFQKWIEISTLRKYNELEFNQAFKVLKDQQSNRQQPFDMIQLSPDDKVLKEQFSRSQNQNFTFLHEN